MFAVASVVDYVRVLYTIGPSMPYTESIFKNYKCNADFKNNSTSGLISGGGTNEDDDETTASAGYPVSNLIHGGLGTKISRFDNLVVPAGLVLENKPARSGEISGGGEEKKLAIFESEEYTMEPISGGRFDSLLSAVSMARKKAVDDKTKSTRPPANPGKKTHKRLRK